MRRIIFAINWLILMDHVLYIEITVAYCFGLTLLHAIFTLNSNDIFYYFFFTALLVILPIIVIKLNFFLKPKIYEIKLKKSLNYSELSEKLMSCSQYKATKTKLPGKIFRKISFFPLHTEQYIFLYDFIHSDIIDYPDIKKNLHSRVKADRTVIKTNLIFADEITKQIQNELNKDQKINVTGGTIWTFRLNVTCAVSGRTLYTALPKCNICFVLPLLFYKRSIKNIVRLINSDK